jgi:hypothetical protein
MDLTEIERRADRILLSMKTAGAPVFQTPRSTLHRVIGGAVHTLHLRRVLSRTKSRYHPSPGQTPLLRYYANAVAHWRRDPSPT